MRNGLCQCATERHQHSPALCAHKINIIACFGAYLTTPMLNSEKRTLKNVVNNKCIEWMDEFNYLYELSTHDTTYMKNCEPLVFFPRLAIDSKKGRSCVISKFSSETFVYF